MRPLCGGALLALLFSLQIASNAVRGVQQGEAKFCLQHFADKNFRLLYVVL